MVNSLGGSTSSRLGEFGSWPMFTRRIATVTISAPAARVASRVCGRSRYLPLPTSRREAYWRPAMVRKSLSAIAFIRKFLLWRRVVGLPTARSTVGRVASTHAGAGRAVGEADHPTVHLTAADGAH